MTTSIEKLTKIMLVIGLIVTSLFASSGGKLGAQPYNEFSVSPKIPNNQKDVSKAYFDIVLSPLQEQTLELVINNSGDQVMQAKVEVFDATTGDNGTLVYTEQKGKDESLQNPLTELSVVETPMLEIAARSSQIAKIKITMPQKGYNGDRLAGIVVKAQTLTNKEVAKEGQGVSIGNEIEYVVGLKVSQVDNKVTTNLNYRGTKAKLKDYKTSLGANIQNDQAIIMKGAKITGTIYEKNGTKSLATADLTNVDIAPNSNFDVIYDWDNKAIKQGDYRISMRAEYLDKVWEWNESFRIDEAANEVNESAFELKQGLPMWLLIIIISASVLIVIIIFWLIIFFKKRKKEAEVE
ncbi:MAG: DUF916 and DUF3324 domain-containing protein [Culicoidibacterales bacterium]